MLTHVDNRITYSGNGNATEFAYQFKILDRTDIKVLLTDADGKEKLLTKDYYVDVEKNVVRYPGYAVGAEVPESERPAVLPTGWKLTIYREVPVTQETDLPDQYPFNQVEDIGDKLTMIAQQLTDTTGRSLKIGVSTSADIDTTIPWENGKSFRISDDGKTLELSEDPAKVLPLAQGVYAQTQAQAQSAAASAAAAAKSEDSAFESAGVAGNSAGEAKTYKDNAKTYMDNAKNYSENVNVFTPSVSADGVLSWTNKAELENPTSVNIKGEKGDKGDTGAAGSAATIRIGTVTTGAPGSEAIVTNVGTANDAVFNFTLPRGEKGADGGIDIDTALSDTSTNPVQNKVIKNALDDKVSKTGIVLRARGDDEGNNIRETYVQKGTSTNLISFGNEFNFVPKGGLKNDGILYLNYRFSDGNASNINLIEEYRFGKGAAGTSLANIKAAEFIGNATSATKATQDGNGDEISKTYAKLSAANKWSAQQSFKQVLLGDERYLSPVVSATSSMPQLSVMHYRTTGAFTLDLSHLSTILEVKASTVFTAFIESSGDYTLTITHAGIIKYMGSASDVALTSAGLLLNILMMKDAEGNVTSIVQASKLEGGA